MFVIKLWNMANALQAFPDFSSVRIPMEDVGGQNSINSIGERTC